MGAFFAMFWTGVVVGHDLGLACLPLLLCGVTFAVAGAWGVATLERQAMTEHRRGPPRTRAQRPGPVPVTRRSTTPSEALG